MRQARDAGPAAVADLPGTVKTISRTVALAHAADETLIRSAGLLARCALLALADGGGGGIGGRRRRRGLGGAGGQGAPGHAEARLQRLHEVDDLALRRLGGG